MGGLPAGDASPGALTPSDLGLPTAVLDHFGLFVQAPLQRSPDLGGIPIRPGPCDQDTAGLGVARLGHGTLPPWRTGGRCRGHPAQRLPPGAWAVKPWQGAHGRSQGHRARARHPTPGLEGRDDGGHTPGLDVLVPCRGATREACGRLRHRADVCGNNAWRRRGRPHHRREPPQVGRAPMGPAFLG